MNVPGIPNKTKGLERALAFDHLSAITGKVILCGFPSWSLSGKFRGKVWRSLQFSNIKRIFRIWVASMASWAPILGSSCMSRSSYDLLYAQTKREHLETWNWDRCKYVVQVQCLRSPNSLKQINQLSVRIQPRQQRKETLAALKAIQINKSPAVVFRRHSCQSGLSGCAARRICLL